MQEVTRILSAIEEGDQHAAEQLLPVVYDELRRLAAQKLAQEKLGQTLEATALVHEAYLRLVDTDRAQHWDSRSHFFAAAAEAMRRILVEAARRKHRLKQGGGLVREPEEWDVPAPETPDWLLALDEALDRLTAANPQAAELVKLRYFAGFSNAEAASLLGMSPRKANQVWAYARARRFGEVLTLLHTESAPAGVSRHGSRGGDSLLLCQGSMPACMAEAVARYY